MDDDSVVKVMVTIDTEEDDWGSYAESGASVENIARVPDLHDRLRQFGVQPTYFVNRPPLIDAYATSCLRAVADDSAAEIGTHCHPWNTPPFEGPSGLGSSMMGALPAALNRSKIAELTRLIEEHFDRSPSSFRAGRWGFGPSVAVPLQDLGYLVDSSVSPFVDWSRQGGPDYSSAPLRPYRFAPAQPLVPIPDGPLVEVPTTVGALHGHPVAQARARARIEKSMLAKSGLVGVLDRMGLLARRWLSPETSTSAEMVTLADNLVRHGVTTLGFTFHSCTLLPGATPFVRSGADTETFMGRIEAFLETAADRGWTFATVSDVARSVLADPGTDAPKSELVERRHREAQQDE